MTSVENKTRAQAEALKKKEGELKNFEERLAAAEKSLEEKSDENRTLKSSLMKV